MNENIIESISNNKLSNDERETHLYFDIATGAWEADSSIPKDYRKFQKMKWETTGIVKHTDGSIISMRFKAPGNAVSFRNAEPKAKRPMSEEKRAELAERLQAMRNKLKN